MREVSVSTTKVLETIKKNRDSHVATYKEAKAEYDIRMVKLLEKSLKKAQKGESFETYLDRTLPKVESHKEDYDRAIQMLEMHTGSTITLDDIDVEQFINDNWSWKRGFIASSSNYISN